MHRNNKLNPHYDAMQVLTCTTCVFVHLLYMPCIKVDAIKQLTCTNFIVIGRCQKVTVEAWKIEEVITMMLQDVTSEKLLKQ